MYNFSPIRPTELSQNRNFPKQLLIIITYKFNTNITTSSKLVTRPMLRSTALAKSLYFLILCHAQI